VPHVRPGVRGTKMMGAAQRSLSLHWPQRLIAYLKWVARHTKLSNQFWSGFTPAARQPFGGNFVPHLMSRIAGVVLPVEMCEESEVSELRSGEQRGVAQKRLRFVSNFSDAGERLGKVTKLGARWPNKGKMAK
jgi:hypothetical protein